MKKENIHSCVHVGIPVALHAYKCPIPETAKTTRAAANLGTFPFSGLNTPSTKRRFTGLFQNSPHIIAIESQFDVTEMFCVGEKESS